MEGIVGIIPARLESTRLERKALRRIAGHPMIVWVYRRARLGFEFRIPNLRFQGLLVATDSSEIRDCCAEYGVPVVMTSPAHRSGTERVIEVMGREPADIYVNIQGDEPMISGSHIGALLAPYHDDPGTQVTTLAVEIAPEEARNPNNVKVATSSQPGRPFQRALSFSRSMIPFGRDGGANEPEARFYKHLGLYAYRRAALERFSRLEPSKLELAERLEQLRFLENGIPITVVETQEDSIGVDEEADIKKVEEFFRRANVQLPA